ncbi:type II toxin-antitoxin system RelB/DinJ family antitoxin [Rhodomicrobium lacus]|uniref:type II toxin-antitoxin system RelB/DinJ family antitoxin n=1 Tax=Rhodomicrobium lacus TaxID=2498452 RepID=UPI000F8D14DC|nr:type II toxin-antitoxin system RelB/DinJ family antitoxin [Rhodomicrobium lacus]
MKLNQVVRARIDTKTKEDAEAVLAEIGLTVSDVVRLLLIRVAREGALPFDPFVPNKETIVAMEDARAGKTIKVGSIERLFEELYEEDRDNDAVQEGPQNTESGAARRRAG